LFLFLLTEQQIQLVGQVGVLGQAGDPVEVRAAAEGHHERVVRERADPVDHHALALEVHAPHAADLDAVELDAERLRRRALELKEANPMLGLRGCRLGLMIPDLVKMQTRAILNAAIARKKAGGDPHAEIMIPLVGHVNELAETRAILEAEARSVEQAAGVEELPA
jgi:pyruvate, orthophosphate dikinase